MKIKSFKEFINKSFGDFFDNINLSLRLQIKKWCDEMGIKNYEIVENRKYGYIINVDGGVNLINKNLKKLPYKFGIVNGKFDISNNDLEILVNCPDKCNWFNCSYNYNLKSLIGGP